MSMGWPTARSAAPVLPAMLDPQRALMACAFCALIDAALDEPHPFRAAERLVRAITNSNLGLVTAAPDQLTLDLFNIRAASSATANCQGLLRNWQTAARDRISNGVRE